MFAAASYPQVLLQIQVKVPFQISVPKEKKEVCDHACVRRHIVFAYIGITSKKLAVDI